MKYIFLNFFYIIIQYTFPFLFWNGRRQPENNKGISVIGVYQGTHVISADDSI